MPTFRHSTEGKGFRIWEGMYRISEGTGRVVHAASFGLYSATQSQIPVDMAAFRSGMIVCDVIPMPPRTRFICDAEGRGCPVLDGLRMRVNQGFIALKLWSGCQLDPSIMRHAFATLFSATPAQEHGPIESPHF